MAPLMFPSRNTGFSLVEVMIAVMVLSIGIVATVSMLTAHINSTGRARRTIVDTVSAGWQLEQISAMAYSDKMLTDTDGAYLLSQPDHGPFKLEGTAGTIEWEVDDDFPTANTKRITVTVRRPGKGRFRHSLHYDYIKVQGYAP